MEQDEAHKKRQRVQMEESGDNTERFCREGAELECQYEKNLQAAKTKKEREERE